MAELYDPNKSYDQVEAYAPQHSAYPQQYSNVGVNPYAAQYNADQAYTAAAEPQVQSWNDPRELMQPQTPIHHMPPAPVFGLPPMASESGQDDAAPDRKASRLKLGRKSKSPKNQPAPDLSDMQDIESSKKAKTSSALPFIMGMVTGMALLFAGHFVQTNILQDSTVQDFRDIERRALELQKPVLPTSDAKAQ